MRRISSLYLLIVLFFPLQASARCGGLCLYEVGIPDQGASGAGQSARANDASTSYTNPAGMTRLDGSQVMFGASLLYLDPQLDLDLDNTSTPTPGETNQGGHFGGLTPLGSLNMVTSASDDIRFGLSMGGSVGGSIDFDSEWIGRNYVTEADIAVLEIMPTAAFRIDDQFSIGIGVPVGYGLLEWDLKPLPGPNSPTAKLEDGDDWGVSALVGVLFEASEDTRIGLVYRAPMELDLGGTIKNPTPQTLNFKAEFDIPQGINLALYQRLDDDLALLADAGWTDWSEFDYQGLQIGERVSAAIPRTFKDTWRVGTGLEWQEPESPLLVRGGVSFDSSAVPDSARLPDTPTDWTWRFSLGGEYRVSESVQLGTSYTLIYAGDQEFDDSQITGNGSTILNGETDNTIGHAWGFTLRWDFDSERS